MLFGVLPLIYARCSIGISHHGEVVVMGYQPVDQLPVAFNSSSVVPSCLRRSLTVSTSAQYGGVSLSLVFTFTSALLLKRSLTVFLLLRKAVKCKGV